MLTPELTGCTITFSLAAADGTARFSHFNNKDSQAAETWDDDRMRCQAAADYSNEEGQMEDLASK